jgi:TatD DNase family protein
VIERLRVAGVLAILLWYSGPLGLVAEALAAGLYFSINPTILRTEKGRRVVAALLHDQVLTESDGPFAEAHGHSAGPADMKRLVSDLADLWQTIPDAVRDQIYDNLASLYAATAGTASMYK